MKNFVKYTFVLAIAAMTFSACHRPGTYIVSFDANGGAGRMRSQVFDEGESQALFQNAYTRDNHTFTGWNTNQNGSGTAYTDGQTITISSDMILYAQWTANGSQGGGSQGGSGNEPGSGGNGTYTITFNANGGTGIMEPQFFTYDDNNTVYTPETLRDNSFTRENYEFAGWRTEPDTSIYNPACSFIVNGEYLWSIFYSNPQNITLYAVWMPISGRYNGHSYVDLGLPSGTLWATCNVGANFPTDMGGYYAWGETTPKNTYTWSSYIYCYGGDGWNGNGYSNLTKYCYNPNDGYNGFADNLVTLEESDDAATVNWGNGWRTPSPDEFTELLNNCYVTMGSGGWRFTSRHNDKTLILPRAGCLRDNNDYGFTYKRDCCYWTNHLKYDEERPIWSSLAELFGIYYREYDYYVKGIMTQGRDYGLSVRPVYASFQK